MKKFAVLFLSLLCLIRPTVEAQTIKKLNEDYENYTTEPIIRKIDNEISSDIYYKWFKIEKEYKGYLSLEEIEKKGYEKDVTTESKTFWGGWTDALLEEKEGREFEERIAYEITAPLKVSYFYLYGVKGVGDTFKITELSIYYNDELLEVNYKCDSCSVNYEENLKNNIVDEEPVLITNGSRLEVKLNGNYEIDKLTVKLELYDDGIDAKSYRMAFDYRNGMKSNMYYQAYISNMYHDQNDYKIHAFTYQKQDFYCSNEKFEVYKTETIDCDNCKVKPIIQKRYRDTAYQAYEVKKIYMDEYSIKGSEEYPNCDFESGIIIYKENLYDMIVIKENVTITSPNTLEENLIEYTNIPYEIIGDIDYEKNGTYKIELLTPISDTFHEVTVSILEIEKLEYEKALDEEKNKYEKEIENLNNKNIILENNIKTYEITLNSKENEIISLENKIKIYEEKINTLENNIDSLKETIELCENNKLQDLSLEKVEEQKKTIKEENSKIKNIDIKKILVITILNLILFISLITLLYFKKTKRKI